MRWDAIAAPAEKVRLAQVLSENTPRLGWNRRALKAASAQAFGDEARWRDHFAHGSRDAIWFISEMSDASMARVFDAKPAAEMSEVIRERLEQNANMKPFVRRVMTFDILHPFQALSRMHRTVRTMYACMRRQEASFCQLTALNLAYTAIVFVWLFDDTDGNARTHTQTRRLMRLLGV